jgi:hypothetical protein
MYLPIRCVDGYPEAKKSKQRANRQDIAIGSALEIGRFEVTASSRKRMNKRTCNFGRSMCQLGITGHLLHCALRL